MGHFRSKNCKVRYSDCPGMNDIQRGSGPHASLCRPASASPLPQERAGGTLGFRLTNISFRRKDAGELCFTATCIDPSCSLRATRPHARRAIEPNDLACLAGVPIHLDPQRSSFRS